MLLVLAAVGLAGCSGSSSGSSSHPSPKLPVVTLQSQPSVVGGDLFDVTCSPGGKCTAGGWVDRTVQGTDHLFTLAEERSGSVWTRQGTPIVGPGDSQIRGVSCPSATVCIAVGGVDKRPHETHALAELWHGSHWSLVPIPDQPGANTTQLNDVSCTSPTSCIAAGLSSSGPGAHESALAERWDGSTWSIQPVPDPVGATDSYLQSVSCASPAACTAVGVYATNNSNSFLLIERWNGSSWSIERAAVPPHSYNLQLNGVSCASATACVAVGDFSRRYSSPLVESWNGSRWALQSAPTPPGRGAELDAVSCTSSTACTGVGRYTRRTADGFSALIEVWDGSRWSIQPTSNRASTVTDTYLDDVSCTSGTTCTIVGNVDNRAGASFPVTAVAVH